LAAKDGMAPIGNALRVRGTLGRALLDKAKADGTVMGRAM
jgi:hypothetical protein